MKSHPLETCSARVLLELSTSLRERQLKRNMIERKKKNEFHRSRIYHCTWLPYEFGLSNVNHVRRHIFHSNSWICLPWIETFICFLSLPFLGKRSKRHAQAQSLLVRVEKAKSHFLSKTINHLICITNPSSQRLSSPSLPTS